MKGFGVSLCSSPSCCGRAAAGRRRSAASRCSRPPAGPSRRSSSAPQSNEWGWRCWFQTQTCNTEEVEFIVSSRENSSWSWHWHLFLCTEPREHGRNMWGTRQEHVQYMWGTRQEHVRNMSGTCQEHVQYMWGTREEPVRNMSGTWKHLMKRCFTSHPSELRLTAGSAPGSRTGHRSCDRTPGRSPRWCRCTPRRISSTSCCGSSSRSLSPEQEEEKWVLDFHMIYVSSCVTYS